MSRRLLIALAASALPILGLSVAGSAVAGPAAPLAPTPVCSGSTCITTSAVNSPTGAKQGGTVRVTFDVSVASGSADLTSIITQQTSGLTPDASSVTFDGTSVPATLSGHTLTINPMSLNPLAAQDYQLDFNATMAATSNADQTSTAAVTFDDTLGGTARTSHSDPVQVQLERPDFSISDVHGPIGPLTVGNLANTDMQIDGPGNTPAHLVLTEPAGFSIVSVTTDNGNVNLPCGRTGNVLTCTRSFDFDFIDVQVRAASTDHVGQTAAITAVVSPIGIGDATPANNIASIPLTVSGTVALSVVFSTPYGTTTIDNHIQSGQLPINRATTITMSVTNEGPDTATKVLGFLNVYDSNTSHYTVSFGPGLDGHQANANSSLPYARWPIGTVRRGQTAIATITITPKVAGEKMFVGLYMQSNERNTLQCAGDGRACNDSGDLQLTTANSVPLASSMPTPSPTSAGTPPATSSAVDPQLANTGTSAETSLFAGLIALLAGLGFVLAGRRRRGQYNGA